MVSFMVALDPSDGPHEVALAHAAIDRFADLLADAPVTSGPTVPPLTGSIAGTMAGGAAPADRDTLDLEELREFLTARASQARSPLNGGERAMLTSIAKHAPAPLPYEENNELLGGGAKFGNVSSGLARRFWFRGVELPYRPAEDESGYVTTTGEAAVILEVLAATDSKSD